ncbi:MAG: hypothetical protein A2087_01465 [Spirochaetes bacterium GWD1_61_31]|nr:MAG: hypothetical protein A2Y37_04385 [Spirochaetes bacterium GWB1_60_80]OHD33497.1 MAG: hypothetical protein A2004_04140 [Spirochaetes bacterium GWC1_61_12]OHD36906.1 MAG: hypothetical protein A2087_01465 [Spirochaetes bacterium GWD1_61_31]OHD42628.1 MAG: hypothetical protein A2Y35_07635 [Spirochaetes bacterium GWE1_60_18]OHD58010.1 MAG: hypothetical protein A2Y32_14340 [Spirochaetes bacterium GWF1_60_12]HAP42617.1 16S rRNA methyltransferase [Spirochaetaceae bacterium]
MNMLLFSGAELVAGLPPDDRRSRHIRQILKKQPGDHLLAGAIDGELAGHTGQATIESLTEAGLRFSFEASGLAEPLPPVTLLLGFPRPIQANRIFKDLCSLGIGRIILSGSELGEKSYIESNFFKHDEYRAALLEGAEQAANPRLPLVQKAWTLARALELLEAAPGQPNQPGQRWALDPYRAETAFGASALAATPASPLVLAIGSERGWTELELDRLAGRGFGFARLGRRILKSETACLVALGVALGQLGWL